MDEVMFLDNDQKLVCLAKEQVTVYTVPDRQEIKVYKNRSIHRAYTCYEDVSKTLVFPVEIRKDVLQPVQL